MWASYAFFALIKRSLCFFYTLGLYLAASKIPVPEALEPQRNTRHIKTVLGFLCIFALGFGASEALDTLQHDQEDSTIEQPSSVRQQGYTYINPLLECDLAEGKINKNLQNFRASILEMIQEKKRNKDITSISVYFRDLNNGPWFGIDERLEFFPASLMKLPTSMNFFKLAEGRPSLLKERLVLKEKIVFPNEVQTIPPSEEIEIGKEYSIEGLIDRALIFSDNQAAGLLYNEALPTLEAKGYLTNTNAGLQNDLNVLETILGPNSTVMSVKNYAGLFRVLYNASFLNRELSEKVLRILSMVEYKDALVAGVPAGTVVAHKFGEAGQVGGERQLHDCGIVYYPNRPYILCIMTRGNKFEELPAMIRQISSEVYRHVDEQIKTGP